MISIEKSFREGQANLDTVAVTNDLTNKIHLTKERKKVSFPSLQGRSSNVDVIIQKEVSFHRLRIEREARCECRGQRPEENELGVSEGVHRVEEDQASRSSV